MLECLWAAVYLRVPIRDPVTPAGFYHGGEMQSSKGHHYTLLSALGVAIFFVSLLANSATPPWVLSAPLPSPTATPRARPTSPDSSWAGFLPTAWRRISPTTASVTVSDPAGLNTSTVEYRYTTNGDLDGASWGTASLTVDPVDSNTVVLNVSGISLVNSATLNKIQFRILDQVGDSVLSPAYTIRFDSNSPDSAITSPAAGGLVNSTSEALSGGASDALSGVASVELQVDGGAWQVASGTTGWTYVWSVPSGEGASHTVVSRAWDVAGNVESTGPGVTFTVDNVPPTSSISNPAPGELLMGATYTISGTALDGYGLSAVQVSIDGGAWQSASGTSSWSYDWPLPLYGTFAIRSRAIDVAGNAQTPGDSLTVVVDNRIPTSTITDPEDGAFLSGSTYTVRGTSSGGITQVEVSVDGGEWATASGMASWEYLWKLDSDGPHSVRSRAIDELGRVETPGSGVNVIVDNTPPNIGISYPSNGAILSGTAQVISGAAADGTSGLKLIYVSTDGGNPWHPTDVASSWTYSWIADVEDGVPHTLVARARDYAGNLTQSLSPTVWVDNVPPLASVLPLPPAVNTADVRVQWSGSDGLGISSYDVQVKQDGGAWTDWILGSADSAATFLGRGSHTYQFRARARDTAGNVGSYAPDGDTSITIPIFKTNFPIVVKPRPLYSSQFSVDRSVANGGDELLYTVDLRNSSSQSVTAAVRGAIPDNTNYIPDSATGGLVSNGSAVAWTGIVAPSGSRTMTFRVKIADAVTGSISGEATIEGGGETVSRNAPTEVVVANGRFDNGNLGGWMAAGTLGTSVAQGAGRSGSAALLGKSSYGCGGSVPVDKGEIFQTVKVPSSGDASLSFWFRMLSQDVEYSPKFGSYGDTLDVNVANTVGNTQQLLLRFGAPFRPVSCDSTWDSGWQFRSYDLSAFSGQEVQIRFALWNGIDGWYNSYAYLDDIRVD